MDTDGDGYVYREDIEGMIQESELDIEAEVDLLLEGMSYEEGMTSEEFHQVDSFASAPF